ncbi:MAG: helix-turn-helix transcriptional regulator [Desulfuromonadales bacterium]|nr:helix-turn-helix transcriptional regulator [Desulfuromonadales bacterium]
MTIGEKIKKARKAAGLTGADLAELISVSPALIGKIEQDGQKFGPSPETVVKIADALNDKTILTTYLENNPVYQSIIPKIFPDLNNIRRDPAIIFSRFATEAEEAVEAARILSDIFSNAEPSNTPNFCEVLKAKLEQVVDVQRCAEVLFLQLIAGGVISDTDRCDIHMRQQRKCIENGHHKPDLQDAM